MRSERTINSRRRFIRSCYRMLIAGSGMNILALCTGFRKKEISVILNENSLQEEDISGDDNELKTGHSFEPSYLKLHRTGELKKRGEELWDIMESCRLCPRMCGVNKLSGNKGFCQADSRLEISSYHPHYGEEKPLSGQYGSGTIFLTNCGLRCVFCINWDVSQGSRGYKRSLEDMADMMVDLQERGCHNINVVTPTHYSPHIVLALDIAAGKGLHLPLVYNTCGWERIEILKKLDGIVDIYLPDFKYWDGEIASKYSSGALTYPEVTRVAILEMHRQVGVAKPAEDGLMYHGLMIRHLVMPNRISGSREIMKWISESLPKDTYVNIMSQYRPVYKANDFPKISRRITRNEYNEVVGWAREYGLTNLDIQGYWF
ncbi:MAG: radical SAM protein [Bacteroidales bacterium]|nr:MAG: radical SAM protein [Bacteroidales bacterium]